MTATCGLLGKKLGMTQILNTSGAFIGATAIDTGSCIVVKRRTTDKDGYSALQLGFEDKPERKTNRPDMGYFSKAGVPVKRHLKEVRVSEEVANQYEPGQAMKADMFAPGDLVDVTSTSKGRGFAGVMKRHGFKGAKASHGVHEYFRHGGSLGQNMTPGRVMKGKKMAGQYGNKQITVQSIEVLMVMPEDDLIFLRGPVPGGINTVLAIRPAKKKK